MGIKRWYRSDGFLQFLLGNAWNNPDGIATGGRATLVVSWIVIMMSVFELIWACSYRGGIQ